MMDDKCEQRSRRSRKKSKSKDSDDDIDVDAIFVDKQLKMAAKQMERAMGQMKLAKKVTAMASQMGTEADMLQRQKDALAPKDKGIVVNHLGHYIHIESAENIQVGSNNTMVITNNSKSKKSSRRHKSYDSDEEKEIERAADRNQEKDEVQTEQDVYLAEVLTSGRIVTTQDIELASQNVGSDWRRLMRFLGLDDALISQLHQDFYVEGVRQVVFQGILAWKRQSGKEATLGKLTSSLKRVGYGSVVQNFKL